MRDNARHCNYKMIKTSPATECQQKACQCILRPRAVVGKPVEAALPEKANNLGFPLFLLSTLRPASALLPANQISAGGTGRRKQSAVRIQARKPITATLVPALANLDDILVPNTFREILCEHHPGQRTQALSALGPIEAFQDSPYTQIVECHLRSPSRSSLWISYQAASLMKYLSREMCLSSRLSAKLQQGGDRFKEGLGKWLNWTLVVQAQRQSNVYRSERDVWNPP